MSKKNWPSSEAELASALVEWLRSECWEVYQEVELGSVADIVAVREPIVWCIETKRSLSLHAINQAIEWNYYAHYSSVATPPVNGRSRSRVTAQGVCKMYGVGHIVVHRPYERQHPFAEEKVHARFNRKARVHRLRERLFDKQKDFAPAGNASGLRWSPWRETCDRLRKIVSENPGIKFKTAVESIETHYASKSSAKSSLSHWLRVGKIDGVKSQTDGRSLVLYPCEVVEND